MAAKALDVAAATARWTGRVTGSLLFLMVAAIMIGEGGPPNPFRLSVGEALQMGMFATMTVGLLVGWRWERVGAALVLGGLAAFCAVEVASDGGLPGGAFPLFAIPGLLYAVSAALGRRGAVRPAQS